MTGAMIGTSGINDILVSGITGIPTNLGAVTASSNATVPNSNVAIVDASPTLSSAGGTSIIDYKQSGSSLIGNTGTVLIGSISGPITNVVNDGTIAVGGTLDVSSVDPSSSGVFQLTSRGVLEIGSFLGTQLKIQFLGTAPANKLIVDSAAKFGLHVGSAAYAGPLLEGFSTGDIIDLKDIASTGLGLSYSATNGDLQIIGSGGAALATLSFQNATLGIGGFHATADGSGGTLITHS